MKENILLVSIYVMKTCYVCPRCGNTDERFLAYRKGELYCRRCISFNGENADSNFKVKSCDLTLDYELSDDQKRLSLFLIENYKVHKNALIHAVTGSGKTELVYGLIEHCLKNKLHVGFAVPRVDIVREMFPRFQSAFKKARITLVYGGHSKRLTGDIIILTTHQLYRYNSYFDLLIMDEIDAFPYKGNKLLEKFFNQSLKGNYVLMSATSRNEDKSRIKNDNGEVFELMGRYHRHPLIVPKFVKSSIFPKFQVLRKLAQFLDANKPVFIFVPSIKLSQELGNFLMMFFKEGMYVSSESEDRAEIIEKFKKGEYRYLVTTSILERGVTVKDLQVIIFKGEDEVYDASTIVQIAGRVGRKIGAETGEVIIYGSYQTKAISQAIRDIKECNKKAHL